MNNGKKVKTNILPYITMAVLFAALIILTVIVFIKYNASSVKSNEFDIDMISSDTSEDIEIGELFIPEFIGISNNYVLNGVSFSHDTVSEIFSTLAPIISCIFQNGEENISSEKQWRDVLQSDNYIYIRLHSQYSVSIIDMFCREIAEDEYLYLDNDFPVHEMIIIPYTNASNSMKLYIRNLSGEVKIISAESIIEYLTLKDIENMAETYSTVLKQYILAKDKYKSVQYSQPLFSQAVKAKNIIITNNVASMMLDFSNGTEMLLNTFDISLDKVAVNSSEEDDSLSYLGTQGIVYIGKSSFSYKSLNNGGVKVSKLLGKNYMDNPSPKDYISAAMCIINRIREIESSFFIGMGELYISGISKTDNKVEINISYSYDNIPILEVPNAINVIFNNGYLISADIYTLTIKERASLSSPVYEWGFISNYGYNGVNNTEVSLCYYADFVSESVSPQWVARTVKH